VRVIAAATVTTRGCQRGFKPSKPSALLQRWRGEILMVLIAVAVVMRVAQCARSVARVA
jgi:hypothetical protein